MSRLRHCLRSVVAIAALAGGGLGTSAYAADTRTPAPAEVPTETAAAAAADLKNLDWTALTAAVAPEQSSPALKMPNFVSPPASFSSLQKNDDGSLAVTVGEKLPTTWESKVGIDFGVPPAPATTYQPSQLPGQPSNPSRGAAWAKVTVPDPVPYAWDKASFDARLDPINDEGKLGATLARSLPIGSKFTVTLQNGYSLTRPLTGAMPWTPPSKIVASSWSTDNSVRLNILPSGTSLAAGATMSSTDAKWLPSLSAEQKLFGGPLSITGTASETATGAISKSITAGFKHTW
jgi:hypothetical protein